MSVINNDLSATDVTKLETTKIFDHTKFRQEWGMEHSLNNTKIKINIKIHREWKIGAQNRKENFN